MFYIYISLSLSLFFSLFFSCVSFSRPVAGWGVGGWGGGAHARGARRRGADLSPPPPRPKSAIPSFPPCAVSLSLSSLSLSELGFGGSFLGRGFCLFLINVDESGIDLGRILRFQPGRAYCRGISGLYVVGFCPGSSCCCDFLASL